MNVQLTDPEIEAIQQALETALLDGLLTEDVARSLVDKGLILGTKAERAT